MSQNPINLALRFILEMVALFAIGYGGWHVTENAWRYLFAIGLPLLMAYLWGAFRPRSELRQPNHATHLVPGWLRLLIEALAFGGGTWGFLSAGAVISGWGFAAIVVVHYAISYDRVLTLLRE